MRVRREVLGDDHVDRATAASTPLDAPVRYSWNGAAWADVWGRDGLDRRTRSLVTLALLAALGHEREFAMHVRAARRTGATPEEIAEALLHVSVYAGVPAANTAFAILRAVVVEDADDTTPGDTTPGGATSDAATSDDAGGTSP